MTRTTFSTTPFTATGYDDFPVNLYTAHALDNARAAGQFGDLLRDVDTLERVPRQRFYLPAAMAASDARPLGLVAAYFTGHRVSAPVDMEWGGERLFRILPGEVTYFYVREPEYMVYATAGGQRHRVKTSEAIFPD